MKGHLSKVWVWGWHSVREALANPQRHVYRILVTRKEAESRLSGLSGLSVKVEVAPPAHLDSLLPSGAIHQGVAAQVSLPPEHLLQDLSPEGGLVLALDQITDPHNVGALWRTAAVLGVQALILTRQHCPPLDGGVAKSACGAMEHVPYIYVSNLCAALKVLQKKGFFCVGLCEEGAQALPECDLNPVVLVVGGEEKGLRQLTRTSCDQLVFIPSATKFSTLNASVAGALGMYHFFQMSR